ncbi:hypothetical protein HWV62_32301 [Athelia sp. TMB]|nr:hypothetical protein HWV62_32301 [Athelia sp. TMB]
MHASPASVTPRGTPSRRGKSPLVGGHSPSGSASGSASQPSDSLMKPPNSTFTSSLDIPVQGAVPINPDSDDERESLPHQSSHSLQTPTGDSKRAPRKSKTDALAALHNHAIASSGEDIDMPSGESAIRYNNNGRPIPVSPVLDMASVKTDAPREIPANGPRPFGLEDCPSFYPTEEEFKDPMAYVRSISEVAQNYGICKVIPPVGWKMPFVTDTERLNSIEASSRAKLNFLEALYRFHQQQGNPRVSLPTINHKPLDLWLLRKEVHKMGGYDEVTKGKKWSDLGRILGYGGVPGLSTQIKNSYTRVILPFEQFSERVKNLTSTPSPNHELKTHSNIQTASMQSGSLPVFSHSGEVTAGDSPPSSPLTATSSPLSEPPDESDTKGSFMHQSDNGKKRRSSRSQDQTTFNGNVHEPSASMAPTLVFPEKKVKDPKVPSEPHCEICHKKNRGEEMLLCDGCDCGFHMFCLDPPLTSIPKGQWFCHTCLFGTGDDFGFDEGEEHSLSSFQARDFEFRKLWFESHPPANSEANMLKPNDTTINRLGNVAVSEYDVETEFWRLVQSPAETVEIEYGADVHSTTHGSAMPTLETHPLDQYSKDPWNLNNIPIVSDSLLRFIKSDISGMTVPWTYVGMVFSTFCWHNEDHYTFSINFMHWGETKTWYGIPGDDAEKFEAAIKKEAPDLFEAQPDLLFQLVTLMNPQRLTDAGVRVYGCNQRAGEFVVTFPKAYHAGFNHGFNFNEAVNFALPEWLSYGRDCVQRYRDHKKLPVFSHDELLITITQQSQSIKTAAWLLGSLKEMIDREVGRRAYARSLGLNEILEEEDRPEDHYQCTVCKMFCYLSQITCQCKSEIVCIDHAEHLCDHSVSQLVMRKRFSDGDLKDTLLKVQERAAMPAVWRSKLNKMLTESARPQFKTMRTLLAEGDRINYNIPELVPLRKCVARGNEWMDAANTYLIRKQSRKRSRRSRGGKQTAAEADDPADRPDGGLEELYALLREVENLGFDCPEIGSLQALAQHTEEAKVQARRLLDIVDREHDRETFIQDCERLLLQGTSINVHLDELFEVQKIVTREQLIKELEEAEKNADTATTLEDIRHLLTRARACNLALDNKYMKLLEDRQRAGDNWEERAKSILAQPFKTIEELSDFSNMDPNIPIDHAVLDRLLSALGKAQELDKQAKAWLVPEAGAAKPKVADVLRLVAKAEKEYSIPSISDLKRTAEIAADLESRCDDVLKNRYQHREDGDLFESMRKWKAYAVDHLAMFALPMFDKLDKQLLVHYKWLESLPWYCPEHKEPEAQKLIADVLDATRPEDDNPPADEYYTCICTTAVRPPPPGILSDAVQCDHCFARFHGECAKSGGSCPFCDHNHWNGTIHKDRSWHFHLLPEILHAAPEITKNYSEHWKQLEIIVHRVDRLTAHIGQFCMFAQQPGNHLAHFIPHVRHYMRKLYKLQFQIGATREESYGLDLASLHRVLAGQPAPQKAKKRRRPKFIFGQDLDKDWQDGTRCICRGRTPYLLGYNRVECQNCAKTYHTGCVFYPETSPTSADRFICPLCCLRKNVTYPYSDVRVKHSGLSFEKLYDSITYVSSDVRDTETYVNTKEMLDNFSKDIVYMKMLPPRTQTLFVELVRFSPGQPDGSAYSNGRSHRHSGVPTMVVNPSHPHHATVHSTPPMATFITDRPMNMHQHIPPPPPWSRWGTVAVPPPGPPPPGLPPTPPHNKKRKFVDSTPANMAESASSAAAKRSKATPPTPGPSSHSSQTVSSPSLAKVLSPTIDPHLMSMQPMQAMAPLGIASPIPPTAATAPPTGPMPSLPTAIRTVKLVVSKQGP